MKKMVVFFLLLIVLFLGALFDGFPIILQNNQSDGLLLTDNWVKDNEFNPIQSINKYSDIKRIILIFSLDDLQRLPRGIIKRKVIVCNKPNLIEQFANLFTFETSGGDIATAESQLVIITTDNNIYSTNIVVDDNAIGIQSQSVGWARAKEGNALYGFFCQFKPCHIPVLDMRHAKTY